MESFAAKRGPDRNPEQDHRGDRSLDPFRETKDRRRCAQHYGCALGTAERHPWVGEIAGAPRIVPVKEGSLDGDEASFIMKAAVVKRSEEHTSELQSLMRISYAVFCLKKKKTPKKVKTIKVLQY